MPHYKDGTIDEVWTSTSLDGKGKKYIGAAKESYFDELNKVFQYTGDQTLIGSMTLGGAADRTVGVGRNTVAGAGKQMTVNAGGALLAETDTDGGDLNLSAGVSTGSGSAGYNLKYCPAGASGTADNAPAKSIDGDGLGNVEFGPAGAIATDATDGFPYVPMCAGIPTGTPSTKTGKGPLVIDSTNNDLYFYDGTWRKLTPV